jgi:uncharacterized protein
MNIRTSPLVEMAEEAQRPTRWWLAWIVGIVLVIGGSAAGSAVGGLILGSPGETDTLYQFIEFFSFGATLLVLFLWVRFKEGRPFSSIGFRGRNPVGKLALGFVIGAVMMTVGVLVPAALGHYERGGSEHTNVGSAALLAVAALVFVFLLQASTEEAVFRGYLLQVTGSQTAPLIAILGTSIFFAVIHTDFRPIVLTNITLYAVFACFVALGQGNLWLIAGLHAGWNFFQGNIYGLPVSGNGEANSLLDFGPKAGSSDLITGGDFGVEASIVGTAILLVATVIAFVYYRRKDAERAAAQAPVATA